MQSSLECILGPAMHAYCQAHMYSVRPKTAAVQRCITPRGEGTPDGGTAATRVRAAALATVAAVSAADKQTCARVTTAAVAAVQERVMMAASKGCQEDVSAMLQPLLDAVRLHVES